MMLPVIEALTTAVWCARRAAIAMISSAALPNVALRNPPSVGPARSARCSVAVPISPAAGISETAEATKIQVGAADWESSHQLTGAATSSTLSQLEKSV